MSILGGLIRASALALAAAGSPPAPEWTRERQAAVTERRLAGTTPAAAASAAEQSLRRAFGRDVRFEYRPNGFVARRFATEFFLIGGSQGTYTFDFQAEPAATGTRARVLMYSDITTITNLGPLPGSQTLWTPEGAYQLFFRRLESFAYRQPDRWLTCPEARRSPDLPRFGLEPLCSGTGDDRAAR
ncbi:MAG TPA: hypothetical protein PKE47_01975 [Verrucomicrobiota bacterium]|nr:hypothetical protein [Verrucomicrobiota bacterium]